MKVKVFDCEHESDLETMINMFMSENNYDIIDIKYCVACAIFSDEQVYCYSALVMYT